VGIVAKEEKEEEEQHVFAKLFRTSNYTKKSSAVARKLIDVLLFESSFLTQKAPKHDYFIAHFLVLLTAPASIFCNSMTDNKTFSTSRTVLEAMCNDIVNCI